MLLKTVYHIYFHTARAGFIASQTEDASCVGTGILASSSGPPTFGCYDRPPGKWNCERVAIHIYLFFIGI